MRRFTLRLLIAFTTFLIGVGVAMTLLFFHSGKPSASATLVPNVNEPQLRKPSPLILEVSSFYGGMSCYEGNLLELRVFADGRAEYEVLNLESPCKMGTKTKPTMKSTDLQADELSELESLFNQSDLLDAKKEYAAFVSWTGRG